MYISQKFEVKRGKIRKYKFGVIRKIGELEYEICASETRNRERILLYVPVNALKEMVVSTKNFRSSLDTNGGL